MGAARVRFLTPDSFRFELMQHVNDYFESTGKSPRDSPWMYLKTVLILVWLVGSYVLLLFVPVQWWQAVMLALSVSLAMAGISLGVQHDANHGAYSRSRTVNHVLGMTLDLVGASSYLWHWRHNINHHTYTNFSGIDEDLDFEPLLRLAPDQPRNGYHRLQHLYMWALYAIMPASWQFLSDFRALARGSIGGQRFPKPGRRTLSGILIGKIAFITWTLIVPLLLHPAWAVISRYVLASFMFGLVLTTTFQLAHCTDAVEAVPAGLCRPTNIGWTEHQLRTTANFAPNNHMLTWFLGGLNHQIEHHLFPRICHVHYSALAPIVENMCRKYNFPYHVNKTLSQALFAHVRWMRSLGQLAGPEVVVSPDQENSTSLTTRCDSKS